MKAVQGNRTHGAEGRLRNSGGSRLYNPTNVTVTTVCLRHIVARYASDFNAHCTTQAQ